MTTMLRSLIYSDRGIKTVSGGTASAEQPGSSWSWREARWRYVMI
jgi:hypothetical protein